MFRILPLVILFVAGCTMGTPATESEQGVVVLSVNGNPVYQARFMDEIGRIKEELGDLPVLSKNAFENIKQKVIQELVEEMILKEQAAALGVSISDEDLQARLKTLHNDPGPAIRRKILRQHYQTETEWKIAVRQSMLLLKTARLLFPAPETIAEDVIRAFWKEHKDEYAPPRGIHLEQIVVNQKQQADKLYKEVKKHPQRFPALAAEHSIAPEKDNGGDLGWVTKQELPESFASAFRLKAGSIARPVQSPYGYHIFRVVEKRTGSATSLEPFRKNITERLANTMQMDRYREGLARLTAEASIKIQQNVMKSIQW